MTDDNPYRSPTQPSASIQIQSDAAQSTLSSQQEYWLRRILSAMWLVVVCDVIYVCAIGIRFIALVYNMAQYGLTIYLSSHLMIVYCVFQGIEMVCVPVGTLLLWRHCRASKDALRLNIPIVSMDHVLRTGCRFWVFQSFYVVAIVALQFVQVVLEIWR